MPGLAEPLAVRVRALLGRARLVYWDDNTATETLQHLLDRLEAPLRVGVRAPDAERLAAAVAAAGAGLLEVTDDHPDAVVQLLDHGAPTGADAPGPEALVGVLAGDPADLPDAAARRCRRVIAAGDDEGLARALHELVADADALRALGALAGLRELLTVHPRHGSAPVAADAERVEAFAPERREIAAAARLRALPVAGLGEAPTARALALLDAARHPDRGVHRRRVSDTAAELAAWRASAQDPTLPREGREIATTVARACERLLAAEGLASGPLVDERA